MQPAICPTEAEARAADVLPAGLRGAGGAAGAGGGEDKQTSEQGRAGGGGKCQAPGTGGTGGTRHSNNLGQCFLCLEQATTQVSLAGDHNFLFPLTRFASSLYKLTACY